MPAATGGRDVWRGRGALLLALLVTIAGAEAACGRGDGAASARTPTARPTGAAAPGPSSVQPRLSDVIPRGRRAVTVGFSQVSGGSGPLEAGDVVDVVAVFRSGTAGLDRDAWITVAVEAPVLDVAPEALAATPGSAAGRATWLRRATLAVTPQEAQALALAQQKGELQLVVRPRDEGRAVQPASGLTRAVRAHVPD